MQPPLPSELLLSQAELLNDCSVTLDILLLQVCEHAAALTYHLQQTTTGMVIMLVLLQMLGELLNALSQDSDLYFRGTGIGLMGTVCCDYFSLLLFADHIRHLIIKNIFLAPNAPGSGLR